MLRSQLSPDQQKRIADYLSQRNHAAELPDNKMFVHEQSSILVGVIVLVLAGLWFAGISFLTN